MVAFSFNSCDKNDNSTDTYNNNTFVGEWFVYPIEKTEYADSDDFFADESMDLADLYVYTPFMIDWKTSEKFSIFEDSEEEIGGVQISVLVNDYITPLVVEGLSSLEFKDDGAILVSLSENGVMEQDYATYSLVSDSTILVKLNYNFLTETDFDISSTLISALSYLIDDELLVDYAIDGDKITFSIDETTILPIMKTLVFISTFIDVPELESDYSNAVEVMALTLFKNVLSDDVINSTTSLDILFSLKK